jgi:hypothetical protein
VIKVLRRPVEFALAAGVGVVHQPPAEGVTGRLGARAVAHVEGLAEGIEDQPGLTAG